MHHLSLFAAKRASSAPGFRRGFGLVVGVLFALVHAGGAAAQAPRYPEKPVHLVIPGAAGTGPDVLARILTNKLAEVWGQPIVVENVAGAGGNIGHDRVAKATPDGYTLLLGMIGPMAINRSLYDKLPFDAAKDFAPISMVAKYPNLLVVHPSLPVHSVQELLAYAKANPDKLRYGSAGTGTTPHLSGAMLTQMTGTRMIHVPYKSSAQMTTDLMAGHIDLMFLNPPAILQHVKAGKMRALAITSTTRAAYAPDIPTMIEAGVPGYELISWYGLFAPAGTPPALVSKMSADLRRVMAMPEIHEKFMARGDDPFGGTPEEAAAFLRSELGKWNQVIREGNIKRD